MKAKLFKKSLSLLLLGLGFSMSIPAVAGACVIVNGRALTRAEVGQVARMTGSVPACGAYLYNHSTGHWVSLTTGASGRIGGSYGNSGGDRFWSSGFSAGNSTADNSQGYVSVPGYGPVSYGM